MNVTTSKLNLYTDALDYAIDNMDREMEDADQDDACVYVRDTGEPLNVEAVGTWWRAHRVKEVGRG